MIAWATLVHAKVVRGSYVLWLGHNLSGVTTMLATPFSVQRRCPRRSIPSLERSCRAFHARGLFMAGSFPAIELGGLLAPDSQADVWGGSGRCVTKVSMSMRKSRSGARIFAGERKNIFAGSSFRWAPWDCTMSLALTCLVPARLPLARSCTPQGRWARCKSPPSSRSSSASASAERSLSSRDLP